MVAEGDDALMEEFFEKGTLPVEDLVPGLRRAALEKRIVPVLVTSALLNIGSSSLLSFVADVFPHPGERLAVGATHAGGQGDRTPRQRDDPQPPHPFAF